MNISFSYLYLVFHFQSSELGSVFIQLSLVLSYDGVSFSSGNLIISLTCQFESFEELLLRDTGTWS